MKHSGYKVIALIFALALWPFSQSIAQQQFGKIAEFDKTAHDFGDILITDGPVSCKFTVKNISDKPIVIYSIVTSCGCTGTKWSREPIQPGRTSVISATYSNDQGAYPFDKTLTVNISGISKPIILHLRGTVREKVMSLEERFPLRSGPIGFKGKELKCGNLEMGDVRSDETEIANLSDKAATISFTDISKGLSLKVSPNPIPAGQTARLTFTVTSMDGIWGKNWYYATVMANGMKAGDPLKIFAFTKENFSNLTKEERANGSRPMFKASTYSFGRISAGTKVNASWEFSNMGKSTFKAYKVDADADKWTAGDVPQLAPGGKGSFSVELDTAGMPKGETLVIVTLTTNSPSRPIVNLFIAGWID